MPTLCLNMIVKNESGIIARALAPLVGQIDHYVICDTGSSDNTVQIIRDFFDKQGVSGEIHRINFHDFEQARNEALRLAQGCERSFDYILLQDADMQLQVLDPNFRAALRHDFYYARQEAAGLSYSNIRLVRKTNTARYHGVTHEYLHCDGEGANLAGAHFIDYVDGSSRSEKHARDIRLLLKGLESEPHNARYRFYLAQTYFDANELARAADAYRARISMGDWDEEIYYSLYRLGVIALRIQGSEADIVQAFLDCFNFRPSRTEPLYELARYYRQQQKYAPGYLFAKAASAIPFPSGDRLFVSRDVYEIWIRDELAICAYHTGRYQESQDLCTRLLQSESLPPGEVDRIRKNRDFAAAKLIAGPQSAGEIRPQISVPPEDTAHLKTAAYSSTDLTIGTSSRQFYFRKQTTDEQVMNSIFGCRQYDLNRLKRVDDLLDFARQQQAKGLRPLIVDAGANIGASSIYFLDNFPNALVVAVEPEVHNFELLAKNIEGLNVEPFRAAISATAGRSRVIDALLGHWGYRTQTLGEDDKTADAVACLTINDIYQSHASGFFPFLVKIDIEGAEGDLFSANTEWVALTPLIIIELHDWLLPKGGTSSPFLQCISRLNRDFVYIGEDIYSIANDLDQLAGTAPTHAFAPT